MLDKQDKQWLTETFLVKDEAANFLTKSDAARLAGKDDLERFATRDDLDRFATKEDLGLFATKEDLGHFATKEDLERVETNLLTEFHKWSSPVEQRMRTYGAAMRALDLEIEALQDRVKDLERGNDRPRQ